MDIMSQEFEKAVGFGLATLVRIQAGLISIDEIKTLTCEQAKALVEASDGTEEGFCSIASDGLDQVRATATTFRDWLFIQDKAWDGEEEAEAGRKVIELATTYSDWRMVAEECASDDEIRMAVAKQLELAKTLDEWLGIYEYVEYRTALDLFVVSTITRLCTTAEDWRHVADVTKNFNVEYDDGPFINPLYQLACDKVQELTPTA